MLRGWRRPDVRKRGNARKSTGREWLLHHVLHPQQEIVLKMRKGEYETDTEPIRSLARLGPHTGDPVRCADVFTAINTF